MACMGRRGRFVIVRFVILLIAGLGTLTWVASQVVERTLARWFNKDLRMRAQLAINGSHRALVHHWRADAWPDLHEVLADVTLDERIMATVACSADLRQLTSVGDYPTQFSCGAIGAYVRPDAASPAAEWREWKTASKLPGGSVFVYAAPVIDNGQPLGFVGVVHDMSFIERRAGRILRFLLIAFGVLSAAASVLTVVAARIAWRDWNERLRKLLQGGPQTREFQPLLQDVRQLVDRIAYERELDSGQRTWTAQRLKQALERNLQGERVVILANREPYIHHLHREDGKVEVLHPASGLVAALEPVMRACSGVWVAHGSGSADRQTADAKGRLHVPPGESAYLLRRVWLTEQEERGYYYGFANEGLWPLCHIAHARPIFRASDWRSYEMINRRFAEVVCEEVDSDDPIVLVQDYHFALAPALIRKRLPKATIISFWHVPWPNAERFGICPYRDELLRGMLGASIVGFHTQLHCNNFLDAVDRYMEARVDHEDNAIISQHRRTQVRAYPISIEWPSRWAREVPPASECRAKVFAELGLRADALLGIGVDRLDYTKGIEERLRTVERLLERVPSLRGRFTFAQLAAPSRTAIDRYSQLDEAVQAIAARINQRFGTPAYRPIVLLRAHHEPTSVLRFYRAADLCYVSSLHDGMNLVAKEFVAAREDEQGVLVLSSFTGAARELTEALIVNPYDFEEASAALATAVHMSLEEQKERMRAMRTLVSEYNVYRWAGRMMIDAARLRRHERVVGRLGDSVANFAGVA